MYSGGGMRRFGTARKTTHTPAELLLKLRVAEVRIGQGRSVAKTSALFLSSGLLIRRPSPPQRTRQVGSDWRLSAPKMLRWKPQSKYLLISLAEGL
jgi:hypothetical protein